MGANDETVKPDAAQCAKDLQALLELKAECMVYEQEAPRTANGSIDVIPPFVVYTANFSAPVTENGVFTIDLYIDVWALESWAACYAIAQKLDDALDGRVYTLASGVFCCDRNGLVMNREEKDPNDARIRRMNGQYMLRFYPL